jgi:hypothetical protein
MNPAAPTATEPSNDQNLFVPGAVDKLPLAAPYHLKRAATAWTKVLLRAPYEKPLSFWGSQPTHIRLQ